MATKHVRALTLVTALVLAALAGEGCERLVSDSATRLAFQIRDEAAALRASGATTRTFVHRPVAWPDGIDGDYRVEFLSSAPPGDGRRGLFTATSYDGGFGSRTTYHLNYVQVPQNLAAAHRKGEPLTVTLELRDGRVLLTGLR
jgi:hypothetical protein